MSYSIGGALIADMEFTRSWGLSPGSASIRAVGSPSLVTGGDYVLTIGADSYYGVLTQFVDETNDGTVTHVSFVDNRVKLMYDTVYGLFNRVEVREDNPLTPGIDRQKRYVHILPDDWPSQIKTYTAEPLKAREIIQYCLDAPTVLQTWSPSFDGLQNKLIHEIDANTGKKLGNVLQEISDAQSLLFTLEGQNTLRWARKGDGSIPGYDTSSTSDISDGEAVSTNDTQITVVGDRNRYQDTGVQLAVDWNVSYEAYIGEAQWMAALSGILGLDPNDFSQAAELAARMRTFTVRELAQAWGAGFADYGMWGEVGRMEIPVWTYLHDIVFKAYRVPSDYTLADVPVESLELVEGLLSAILGDLTGIMTEDTSELYPDVKAYLLVQGQPLGLVDPTKQRVITEEELAREAVEFAPNNKFNLDTRNKTIIFHDPVFVSTNLFIFPNKDISDCPESLKHIAIPNANATISDAVVLAALVWDADRYRHEFGSGERQGSHYVPGLTRHTLKSGIEIKYADDQSADEKAADVAASLTVQDQIYASGGFTRNGATGTVLTGAIDRVTVRLAFETGITERVEYSKERPQSNFEAERDLERKQKSKDLFPGQRKLRDESKELKLIAKVSKELKRSPLQPVYGSLAAVMEKPVGASDCSVVKIFDDSASWLAGTPVFLGSDDHPAQDGKRFAGIVIQDGAMGIIPCATQGIVPVRVTGPFETNDTIGIDTGADQIAKVDGELFIGRMVSESYGGTETILAMVQLGAGAGAAQGETPFQVISRVNPDNGALELGVISNSHLFNSEDRNTYEEDNSDWGLLDDDQLGGWFGNGEIDIGSIGDKIWLKITLNPEDQAITAIDIEHGPAWDGYPDPVNINTDDPGNPYQEFFYQIVAEITNPDEDPRPGMILKIPGTESDRIQVTQLLYANLMMTTAHTTSDADEPGLPLLVAIPWNVLPGTDAGGNANEIPPEDNMMTPWQLGDQETLNDYNFELFNASEPGLPKVLILDGVVYGPNNSEPVDPDGMPSNDTYVLDVEDGDEIWVEIDYDASSYRINSVSLNHGETTPDDTEGVAYITIGNVTVDDAGDVPIVSCRNEICGDIFWQPDRKGNDYNFEMFDASDEDGAKVLILDGVVYGPNNDGGVDPDGMPSDDSYIIDGISDEDEIWLQINWSSSDPPIIESVSIEYGPSTPDDTEGVTHITIGNIQIDASGDVPIVNCRNELTGDASIEIPPYPDSDKFVLMAKDGNLVWEETDPCTPPP